MGRHDLKNGTVILVCHCCHSIYHPYYGREKISKYCSRACRGKHFRFSEEIKQKMSSVRLGRFGMEKHPRWKGRILRSGYWYIKMPTHPRAGKQGYIAEHRIVIEKSLGRILEKKEVVHHINGNTADNRLENLQLFATHGEHTKLAHPDLFEKQKVLFRGKRFSPATEFKKKNP